MEIFFGYFLACILIGLPITIGICASFEDIAYQKGHKGSTYFWWCFWMLPLGALMVIALPDLYARPINNMQTNIDKHNADKKKKKNTRNSKTIPVKSNTKKPEINPQSVTSIIKLDSDLYTNTSPLIIQSGSLMCDNSTKKSLVLLNFKNIEDKIITAIKVKITSFDIAKNALPNETEYEYNNIKLAKSETFGDDIPVFLNNINTKRVKTSITEVIFQDNSNWINQFGIFSPLVQPQLIEDTEIIEQATLQFKIPFNYKIVSQQGLWTCACGTFNKMTSQECMSCNSNLNTIASANFDVLKQEYALRKQL